MINDELFPQTKIIEVSFVPFLANYSLNFIFHEFLPVGRQASFIIHLSSFYKVPIPLFSSTIHSLQEPGNNKASVFPIWCIANKLWQAVTPEPQ